MNSSKSKSFLLMLVIFVLFNGAGCAFKKDDPRKATPAVPTAEDVADELERKRNEQLQQETISIDDFTFEILEGEAPDQYFVKVNYPDINGVTVHMDKNDFSLQTKPNTPTSLPVLGGDKLIFKITAYNSSGVMVLSTNKHIEIPKDLVVARTLSLNSDTKWAVGRLYFDPNATLKTNGHLVSIDAKKIFASEKSQIITFNSDDVWTTSGTKSGGTIAITAKEATGQLIIHMTGAKGKNGRSGSEIESLLGIRKARDGNDGDDGKWDGDEDCTEDRYSGQLRCGIINIHCSSQPTNGENGEDGPDGADGEKGADGGDTGSLFILIDNNDNFKLRLSLKPGLGGIGGKGAPGKSGGKGGKAGALDQQKVCKPAAPGKAGAPGNLGLTREDGQSGSSGTIELNGLRNVIIF